MITPYDWQEGIGNRAQYIEGKLRHGSPVLAVSLDAGILVYTKRRQSKKIYEVYDRLAFAAIGQQSDVEALRSSAVEFAHQEGYNRSEQDVTIQRVVTALSAPVKKAFSDFSSAPLVARSLFLEINAQVDEDRFYILNYDGDYMTYSMCAAVAGTDSGTDLALASMAKIDVTSSAEDALVKLQEVWQEVIQEDDERDESGPDLIAEAVLIERSTQREDRFRLLNVEG